MTLMAVCHCWWFCLEAYLFLRELDGNDVWYSDVWRLGAVANCTGKKNSQSLLNLLKDETHPTPNPNPSQWAYSLFGFICFCPRKTLSLSQQHLSSNSHHHWIPSSSTHYTHSLWDTWQTDGWACFKLSNGTIIPALRLCQDSIQRVHCSKRKGPITQTSDHLNGVRVKMCLHFHLLEVFNYTENKNTRKENRYQYNNGDTVQVWQS